ncbi:MAG: leucine-rich repeat domain-containing protein, partial [Firmicutes bacterium]|nr:leucine-rich repeat domain-containing protein [Bacillota bacterium]
LYEGIVAGGYKNAVYVTNPVDMEKEIRKVISEGDLILFKGLYNMDLTPIIDRIFGSNMAMLNPYYIKQAVEVENAEYRALKFPVVEGLDIIKAKKSKKSHVVIPDEIDGVPVHSVTRDLFRMNKHMKTLDLGKRVMNLGRSAFAGCLRLKKVTIPGNVKVIGPGAFQYCVGLREVVIEDGVTQIEENAFKGCFLLSKVTIPDSVKYIDPTAFDKCIFMNKKL